MPKNSLIKVFLKPSLEYTQYLFRYHCGDLVYQSFPMHINCVTKLCRQAELEGATGKLKCPTINLFLLTENFYKLIIEILTGF